MARQMKGSFKLVVIAAGVVSLIGGARFGMSHGWIPTPGILTSVVPQKAALPDVKDAVVADVTPAAFPSTVPISCSDPIRFEMWQWNSQFGAIYANGGPETTTNSLVAKHGGCLKIENQDDTEQMKADLVACAKDLASGTECSSGAHFVAIMLDGGGQFAAATNPMLQKVCKDCAIEIVGSAGYSRGEDKFMGPEGWKRNPQSAKGDGLIAGVILDGDWNIAEKWAADNGIKNNPDEKTFDPDALNWVNAPTFTDAAQKYVAGYCEDRKVAKDGKLTGETIHACVKGVVTWTPGDVTVARQKGGIVSIVSTKQYRSQMPNAIIGINKWNKAHADKVAGMLAAFFEGGDQIKAFPEAQKVAAKTSWLTYKKAETPDYWLKYYKGVTEADATGKQVELGGSYANNLNDNLVLFGLAPGANNNAKATYSIFKAIDEQQYPQRFKDTPIPPFEKVVNTSYLLQAQALMENHGSAADTVAYGSGSGDVVSAKNFAIEFATGSAQLTQSGYSVVRQIKDQVAITGLTVTLNGHTDSTGNPDANRALSEARAESVKQALQKLAPVDFPESRFSVHGYGPDKPIASNATEAGRARNRRVEVILSE